MTPFLTAFGRMAPDWDWGLGCSTPSGAGNSPSSSSHPYPQPSTCPRSYRTQTVRALPFLSSSTASFLPIADVALGLCGLAGAGSGCLPWLPPCLDFSPVTNPCPGPSAQPANSSVPFLPALMSSRLSALPENLPGHAARLHLGDLVTISSPRGFPPAQRAGGGKRGKMERVKDKSPVVLCSVLGLFWVQGTE